MKTIAVPSEERNAETGGDLLNAFLKRAFDILASGLGLVLLAPLLLLTAAAIKMTSPGPVFYRGVRTGRFGEPFRIFKFRSMVVDAESRGGTTTGKNDARVTPLGHVLRKYKIDELPQLLNVFCGDMSMVGPRPEVEEYTSLFEGEELRILDVRPGITDLSSLRFHNLQEFVGADDPDRVFREQILPQKNALRVKYVQERSLRGDFCILFKTVYVLCTRPFRSQS